MTIKHQYPRLHEYLNPKEPGIKDLLSSEELEVHRKLTNVTKSHSVTIKDYLKLLEAQNDSCGICEIHISKAQLVVDHDHKTGLVRGLLCGPCNSLLSFTHDNPETLKKAAKYLENKDKEA